MPRKLKLTPPHWSRVGEAWHAVPSHAVREPELLGTRAHYPESAPSSGVGRAGAAQVAMRRAEPVTKVPAKPVFPNPMWAISRVSVMASNTDLTGACGKALVGAHNLRSEPEPMKKEGWPMPKHAVVIAGSGPTGMMLAAALARAPYARPGFRDCRWPGAGLHSAARRQAGAAQPW